MTTDENEAAAMRLLSRVDALKPALLSQYRKDAEAAEKAPRVWRTDASDDPAPRTSDDPDGDAFSAWLRGLHGQDLTVQPRFQPAQQTYAAASAAVADLTSASREPAPNVYTKPAGHADASDALYLDEDTWADYLSGLHNPGAWDEYMRGVSAREAEFKHKTRRAPRVIL
jgi:hypothetical protein